MKRIVAAAAALASLVPFGGRAVAVTDIGFVPHNQWRAVTPFTFAVAGGGFCSYKLHYRHGNLQFAGQPLTSYAESRASRVASAANKCNGFAAGTTLDATVTIGNLTSRSVTGPYTAPVGAGLPAAASVFASKVGAILGSQWIMVVPNPAGGVLGSDKYVASGI